jgi:hypothetical protein
MKQVLDTDKYEGWKFNNWTDSDDDVGTKLLHRDDTWDKQVSNIYYYNYQSSGHEKLIK